MLLYWIYIKTAHKNHKVNSDVAEVNNTEMERANCAFAVYLRALEDKESEDV